MRIRMEPQDEYMHALEEAETFNESMYFNVYDPKVDVGGWFRLGNRANEGYAEMTTCLYLPAGGPGGVSERSEAEASGSPRVSRGPVGFMYARPPIDSNDAFDAGGMRFEVVEPFKELRVTYEGKVAMLDDPLAMKDPRSAFTNAPHVDCAVDFSYRGLSPMWGGEPTFEPGEQRPEGMEFARGHYEQHVGARGRIACGPDSWEIDGYGLRDHSWGPRTWQAPYWYRWLTCNAGEDNGFMVSIIAGRDGKVRRSGIVFENGGYTPIVDASLETSWTTDNYYQEAIRCVARTTDREIEITGKVRSFIPLRNRRSGQVTRIGEGLTEYSWEGKTGYGLSEYLDQMEDGQPVGVDN